MGLRARAIEEALKPRDSEDARLRALAAAFSGMSASAGSFGGKMPQSPGFNEALNIIGEDRKAADRDIYDRIKVAGMADEENRKRQPLDKLSRSLLKQRISELPIVQSDEIDIPETMTIGQIEDNPVLAQLYKGISTPKEPSVRDEILRNQELMKKTNRKRPISDIDRQFLNKRLRDAGINKELPPDYTYGDVEDNIFFKQFQDKMKGEPELTPYQKKSLELRERAIEAGRETKKESVKESIAKEERQIQRKQDQEINKAEEIGIYLTESIDNLSSMLEKYGTSEITNPAIDAEMKALAGDIRLEMKELKNLGVLNGPDLAILMEQIPDVGGVSGIFTFSSAAKAKLRQAKEQIQRKIRVKREVYGGNETKAPTGFPRTIRKGNQQATVSNQQELEEARAEGWQ